MKITANKGIKQFLSIVLAFAMVIGTLFVANSGNNAMVVGAETTPFAEGAIDTLEYGDYLLKAGSTSTNYDTKLADNGETGANWDNAIIIDSAEEFVYLATVAGNNTKQKYYKVADGIKGFDLSGGTISLDGTLDKNIEKIKSSGKSHAGSTTGFQGYFDGNGATVYGAYISGSDYAGIFPCTQGNVIIKNIGVSLCYFNAKTSAGGIIGLHKAEGNLKSSTSLYIENCSVSDCYIESTGSGWGTAIGAIAGRLDDAPSYVDSEDHDGDKNTTEKIYVNALVSIKNCFVKLDEKHFISKAEDGVESSGERACHGGVAGMAGGNALKVSDCIVLGVAPYATNESTQYNDVQHTGLSSHFTNVYTDQPSGMVVIGGQTGWAGYTQDFSGKVFTLSDAQFKGKAAASNMNLDWFSTWIPGEEGKYPTLAGKGYVSDLDFWDGTADTEFASGDGSKENPYIIKTAEQLYLALTKITGTTATTGDLAVETAESVAGGTQTSRIFKQGSTSVYVPVYTPYYYKVDSSVKSLYLNNVYGSETLAGAKAMAATSAKKEWKPGKNFVGYLDGNGVTIYGMYCSSGQGLIYKLDGSSTVKNFNFDACYATGSGNSALVTTNLGSYSNDSTRISVSNISVRNAYIATTRNITLKARTDTSGCYDHDPGSAGIISTGSTPENITISNCFYDGVSCERAIGANSEATIDMIGAIYSGASSANNFTLSGCVSLGAPVTNEVYVSGKEVFYNRYDKSGGFEVFFYNNYTDIPLNQITTTYPNKYDKLKDITRIEEKDAYEMYDLPKLSWGNWKLVTDGDRVIPMPTVNTAEQTISSYIEIVGKGQNKYAGTGPYAYGSNPYTYLLKGAGTEENPYIIETDEQLARAIATGGMNLYDKLYYKLANDIDLSSGAWINQSARDEGGIYYTYTPFGGVLDGDGHTITGLSASDSASAGLIPVLAGGTVKNLSVKDSFVVSSAYAGGIVGEIDPDYAGTIENCSTDNVVTSFSDYSGAVGAIVGYHDSPGEDEYGKIVNCYSIGDEALYFRNAEDVVRGGEGVVEEIKNQIKAGKTDEWYIGGKNGSLPRLKVLAEKTDYVDVDGDGIATEYTTNDLISLRNKLLRKSDYKYIFGDVSRDNNVNIADLAVLRRIMVEAYGDDISDSFFANVQSGNVKIYYGENDNYDAARKIELYLETVTGVDVQKVVSSSKGTVTGASSDKTKVYLHAGDTVGTPDGELEIIVGNIDNHNAYKTNTVATAANSYAVTYDAANKVVWLQGENFTAVEQAAINFTRGSYVQGDTVYTCAATQLSDEKKPITVQLDTNFDGKLDTNKTLYYAWGDEFEGDMVDTYNWEHNSQQSESVNGEQSNYKNQEIAPVKDLSKVLVVSGGKLSMKRAYDKKLGNSTNGYIPLDVTAGEYNGYNVWSDAAGGYVPAIDADGSDQYFSSGKITTQRGMLFKQGYIEFEGQLPADGHAFPAWWLMGRPAQSQSNRGYDYSLYGKVYKINNNWNGSDTWDKTNLDTYKYQIPTAIYEIDMIEVMQAASHVTGKKYVIVGEENKKTWTTAVGWYGINTTIHKWWNSGVAADNKLYVHDWDNYKVLGGITNDAFATTSSAGSWIHNPGSTLMDFGSTTNCMSISSSARDDLQKSRRYGFSWYTNAETGFEATLYVYNDDGTVRKTLPIASGASIGAMKDKNDKTEVNGALGSSANVYNDAKVFNQYMYILLDNKFYSSNEDHKNGATVFTDLLTAAGLTSLEIDYVRVYQQDNQRDIVTPETENFNNNNHFGY